MLSRYKKAFAVLAIVVGLGVVVAVAVYGQTLGGKGVAILPARATFSALMAITSDNGNPYTHGTDGQVTIGREDPGRFRLNTTVHEQGDRKVSFDVDTCVADCNSSPAFSFTGTADAIFQSQTEYADSDSDGKGDTPLGSALNFRKMNQGDVRFCELQIQVERRNPVTGVLEPVAIVFDNEVGSTLWSCSGATPVAVKCDLKPPGSANCTKWTITATSADKACFWESPTKNWKTQTMIFQGLYSVPFVITLELL